MKMHPLSRYSDYVLVDSDIWEEKDQIENEQIQNPSAASYISCLLKFASKCYDAHIDLKALSLHEWQRVTKYNSHNSEDTKRNTLFLHNIEKHGHYALNQNDTAQNIKNEISSYFSLNFEIQTFKSLQQDDLKGLQLSRNSSEICGLYEENGRFKLILERKQLYPDPEERARSILEDLRESCIFEKFFYEKLAHDESGKKNDSFLVRKIHRDLSTQVMQAMNITEILNATGIFQHSEFSQFSLCKLLMECESLSTENPNEAVKDSSELQLSSVSSLQCAYELKHFLLDELQSSVEIIFRILREATAEESMEATVAIQDLTDKIVQRTFSDELLKLRFDPQRKDSMERSRSLQILRRAVFIHSLVSRLETKRPFSLVPILNYESLLATEKWTNFSFLSKNYDPKDIPRSLCVGVIPQESLLKVIKDLKGLFTPRFYEPELNETVLKFKANHLYVSQCITPQLRKWIALFRESCCEEPEIVVVFEGTETLTIDVDLGNHDFHGVNVEIVGKNIYVGTGLVGHPSTDEKILSNPPPTMITIDVSGLDAKEHKDGKAAKPTATGVSGSDGLDGASGGDSGNVLISAKERIFGLEYLRVLCKGGKGARGQDAGDGTDGADGLNGKHGVLPEDPPSNGKRLLKEGTKGMSGEDGGSSGSVGVGGQGGTGGIFEIRKGSEQIQEPRGKDGEAGKDGNVGVAGKGGKGGKHGIDRAYIKYSGWVWHPWEKVEGMEGQEKLILSHHNGYWAEGYELEGRESIPPTQNGVNGLVSDSQKATTVKVRALQHKLSTPQQSQEQNDSATSEEKKNSKTAVGASDKNQIKECLDKQKLLRSQRSLHLEKIREIDDLRSQISEDHKRMKQELASSTIAAATRAQESYAIQNPFNQENRFGFGPSKSASQTVQKQMLQSSFLTPNEGSGALLRRDEPTNKAIFLEGILSSIQSVDLLKKAEQFIKAFTFEKEANQWWNAAIFLKELTQPSLSSTLLSSDILLQQLPNIYQALRELDVKKFPHFNEKNPPTTVLIYLFELVKLDRIDLELVGDALIQNCKLNNLQKKKLQSILVPFYASKFVPLLRKAVSDSKTKLFYRARQVRKKKSKHEGSSERDEQDNFEAAISSIINWKIEMDSEISKTPTQLLDEFGGFLKKNSDPNVTLQGLLEKFFSSKDYLNYGLDDVISISKKGESEVVAQLKKFVFITENYEYGVEELEKIHRAYYTLLTSGKQNFAPKIKDAVEKTFRTKFQDQLVEDIFEKLNFSLENTTKRKDSLENRLGSMGSFAERLKLLESMVGIVEKENRKNLNWDILFDGIRRSHVMSWGQAEKGISEVIKEKESVRSSIGTLVNIQCFLKHGEFQNLHNIEMSLIKLQGYLKNSNKYPAQVVDDMNQAIASFWMTQLKSLVVEKVRQRFNPELYQEWKKRVVDEVEVLLDSNLVVEREEYSNFISAKLTQIVYLSLRDGRIKEIERISLHSTGDELDRLKSVLQSLDNISNDIPFPSIPTLHEAASFIPPDTTLLTSEHETPDALIESFNEFSTNFVNLLGIFSPSEGVCTRLKENAMILSKHVSDLIPYVFLKWRNHQSLYQFHETQLVERNSPEAQEFNKKITGLIMKNVNINPNLTKPVKNTLREYLIMVKHAVTQNVREQENKIAELLKILKRNIKQRLFDLDALLDDTKVDRMVSKSLETDKTVVSAYINQWNDFNHSWEELLTQEEHYFAEAMEEAQAEWVDLVTKSSSTTPSTLPLLNVSKKELIRKLHVYYDKSSAAVDGRILPAINLSLELFEALEINDEESLQFLQNCLKINVGSSTLEGFCALLKTTFTNHQHVVGIEEYCQASVSNSVRKLVVRLVGSNLEDSNRRKILNLFLEEKDTACEVKDFVELLTPSERAQFENAVDTTKSSFQIPGNVKKHTNWGIEFQHIHMQNCFSKLISEVDEGKKEILASSLQNWSKKINTASDLGEKWLKVITEMGKELAILPISFEDLNNLICIFEDLPFPTVIRILSQHVPQTYLKNALLAYVEIFFSTLLSKGKVAEALGVIEQLLLAEAKSCWENFLKKFIQEISVVKSKSQLKELVYEVLQPATSYRPETRTAIISRWNNLPSKHWKKQLKIATYDILVEDLDGRLMDLVIELDEKFPHSAVPFIKHLKQANMNCAEMAALLEYIIQQKLVIDSSAVAKLQNISNPSEIQSVLTTYAEAYHKKELIGTAVVDALKLSDSVRNQLLTDIREIKKQLKDPIQRELNQTTKIKDWSEEDVRMWVRLSKLKSSSLLNSSKAKKDYLADETNRRETFAVILRGIQLLKGGLMLRDTQIAAVLLFLYAAMDGVGRFGEIATGEGKTLISAVSALFLALAGNNIYVITSSQVLAKDGYEEMAPLFKLFGIGVGNISAEEYRTGSGKAEKSLREMYKHRVLYGDAGSFQADVLHNKYLGKSYKGGADARYLIVDEVDSLLLDKGSNVLYISHLIPELASLRNIFLDIWSATLKGNMSKSSIYRAIRMKYIQTNEPKIFKFLIPFVEKRLPIWIYNAAQAKNMTRNVPYMLAEEGREKKVTIMDGDTGVEQKQTQYSYGLHQFLQLKEGNKISAESLKAVFISNVGYFQGFKGRIFGITGTLGDESSRNVLKDLYDVDFFKLPRFRTRKCVKEPPQFFKKGEDELYFRAVSDAVKSRRGTQPILFICENVKQCKELRPLLEKAVEAKDKLICIYESKKYDEFRSRMEKKDGASLIAPGDVIISTNLAGRGTDIKLSNECDSKGLHVALLYIPPNVRVEKQAFGRTARKGENGSTEYIVLLDTDEEMNLETHWEAMFRRESSRLEEVKERQVPQIRFEEQLFIEFAKKLKEAKGHFESTRRTSKLVFEVKVHILKNRWAFWLDGIQPLLQRYYTDREKIGAEIWEKYREFCKALDDVIGTDENLCYSPSDYLKLSHAYDHGGNLELSKKLLKAGLKKGETKFNEALHYYLAVGILKEEETLGKSLKRRRKARQHLKLAQAKLLQREQRSWEGFGNYKATLEQWSSDAKVIPDFYSLNSQIDAEVELLQLHGSHFVSPALGYALDETSFRSLPSVNQNEEESREIYFAVVAQRGLMKPIRLSKKVGFNECGSGVPTFKGEVLDFRSLGLELYEKPLAEMFKRFNRVEDECNIPHFDKDQLSPSILTRDELLTALRKAVVVCGDKGSSPWLEGIEEYTSLTINYDDSRFTREFNSFPQHKATIGKALGEKNLGSFVPSEATSMFPGLTPEKLESLVETLIREKYLVQQKEFKGRIRGDAHGRLKYKEKRLVGLPLDLERYQSLLAPWLVDQEGMICPAVDTSSLRLLITPSGDDDTETGEREKEQVLQALFSAGVLKKAKVSWSLSTWIDEESEREDRIGAYFRWKSPGDTPTDSLLHQLRRIFYTFHEVEYEGEGNSGGSSFMESILSGAEKLFEWDFASRTKAEEDFKKYLESIKKLLADSVGTIKRLSSIKLVEPTNIAKFYEGRELPLEYFGLREEGFDTIPVMKEKFSWWGSGAAWVILFGVLQIAAGVAVAVLSGGTLANVSMMLISEGGGDLIFAAHCGLQGSFSKKSYAIHKAFSVACSLATGGLGGISGGSWATVVALEVAEEVFKKTAAIVGRYAVQAVGSALVNMTIEKILDTVREKLFSGAKVLFQTWSVGNEGYRDAKKRLRTSLSNLYEKSYRVAQLQTAVYNARGALGPNSTSLISHTLKNSMQRLASFYMAKLSEKLSGALSQGILENGIKLLNLLYSVLGRMKERVTSPLELFATDYVHKLSEYFERQAKILGARVGTYTHADKAEEEQKKEFIELTMRNIDAEVVDSGLQMLQHEMAEPALKQMTASWFDSQCNKRFKGLGNMGGNESSFLKQLKINSVPSTAYLNTRLDFDDGKYARWNVWDSELGQGVLDRVQHYFEEFETIHEHCEISEGLGEPVLNLMIDLASKEQVWMAEMIGVNFLRKIIL